MTLTVFDGFCGAGGSSSGIESVPGVTVHTAVNHWQLALDTHNINFPHVRHDQANIRNADPRRYATTDIAWFSPECTFWSQARGEKPDYTSRYEQPTLDGTSGGDPEQPEAKEARQRSRLQMQDVVTFSRHHLYRAVIVENVTDILKWAYLDDWLGEMAKLDYQHKVIILNSAFAHAFGPPAPQLRDRVYVVFWQTRYRAPNFNKWLRPATWCCSCQQIVRAMYSPKPGPRRTMRYGPRAQYVYRCPQLACRGRAVAPYMLPALAVLDLSVLGERIGDRRRQIKPKTYARIDAALRKHGRPVTAEVAGNTFERRPGVRAWPVDRPLTAQTTTATKAVACPPLLVPAGGTRRRDAAPADRPMPTRTTRENDAVVVPPLLVPVEGRDNLAARPATIPGRAQTGRAETALVVPLRNNGVARPAADYPAPTFAAGGTHHALVMRNNTSRGDAGYLSTPVAEPLRAVTTAGHQSLITWDDVQQHLYSYDTGMLRPLDVPLPTQTTVEGDALFGGRFGVPVRVEDCTLRMLMVREIQGGMGLAPTFTLLGNATRDKVRMLGNAVTPPAARDLMAAVVEAVTDVDLPLADFALVAA